MSIDAQANPETLGLGPEGMAQSAVMEQATVPANPVVVRELMPEGFAILKDPKPEVRMVIGGNDSGPSAGVQAASDRAVDEAFGPRDETYLLHAMYGGRAAADEVRALEQNQDAAGEGDIMSDKLLSTRGGRFAAGLMGVGGAFGAAALVEAAPASASTDTHIEASNLALLGSNTLNRTIELQTQASTIELGRAASMGATTEATATEASVSYIPEDDQPSGDTPPPATVEETPPPEVIPPEATPPEEVPPATAAELKKACVDAGLAGPEVLSSYMVKPGVSSKGPSQSVEGRFLYDRMPKFCKEKFKRFASFLVKIKDKVGNKWRNMTNTGKKYWDGLQIDEAGEYTDQEGKALAELSLYPSGHGGFSNDPNSYYFNKTCRKVISFVRTRIVKNKPRKVHDFPGQPGLYRLVYPKIKEEIKRVPVELLGKCAKRVKR